MTPQLVETRLAEAVLTLRRLPYDPTRGLFSAWPEVIKDAGASANTAILQNSDGDRLTANPPPRDAITRMDEALGWLSWLDPEIARLTWARAERVPWKCVAWRHGVSVRTAQRHRDYALGLIVWRLHRRSIPRTWSRRFLLARVEALSRGK